MTEQRCTERVPSPDARPHVCRRTHAHRGTHACTCGFTWRWIEERNLTTVFPDLETEPEPA